MRLSKTSLLVLLPLLVLAGCSKPDRQSGESSGASFVVKNLTGKASLGPIAAGVSLKIPQTVLVGFEACLKYRDSGQDFRNQPFFVSLPGTAQGFEATTNSNGCLHWNEELAFNYFAGRSGWVTLVRDIVARGANSGKRSVEILFNPWAVGDHSRDDGEAVVFSRDGNHGFIPTHKFSADVSQAALSGQEERQKAAAQIIVQHLKVKAIPEGEGSDFVNLNYIVEMEPRIRLMKEDGRTPVYLKVPDGELNLWMQLLATNAGAKMDEKVLVMGGEPFSVAHVVDGKLQAELHVRQERRVNQGNLELALKLEPSISQSILRSFNGLFPLGAGTVASDASGSVRNQCLNGDDSACDFAKVVKSATNFQELEKTGYLKPNQRYIFSKLQIRFLMVQPGETATQRTIAYTASTCITDAQTGARLADTPMIIRYKKNTDQPSDVEREVIEKATDQSGCLNWDGMVFHKYYKPEEYFERNITIEKASGFKQDFTFYLNPWDTNINFGFDSREFTKDKIDEIRGRPKIRSRFFVGAFNYHTVRFLYNIDPAMDLEVKKTVLLELDPHVLRYSGIKDARKNVEHLRDGIYLLKVAIQKSYLDPRDNSHWLLKNNPEYRAKLESVGGEKLATKEYVTTNMALVRVVDGMIIFPIELTMHDLRLMRVRSNFMVELQTVDERMVQAYHVFKKYAIDNQDLERKLRDFKNNGRPDESIHDLQRRLGGELSPALDELAKRRDEEAKLMSGAQGMAELQNRVANVQKLVSASLSYLKRRLENGGALGTYLNSSGKSTGVPAELIKDGNIIDNFQLNDEMLRDLRTALNINDFSEVSLPAKQDVDLNLFVENDSGLDKRTFVGPVIYLSNGYSDSVRATDNLDEANCVNPKKKPDALYLSKQELLMNLREKELVIAPKGADDSVPGIPTEATFNGNRQNNAYQYNPYFGSLTHLCYKHVDDLMEREKEINTEYENRLFVSSLKYNFVKSFNLDFVSLSDEPLSKIKADCQGPLASCLETTKENTFPSSDLHGLVNQDLKHANFVFNRTWHNMAERWRGVPMRSDKESWAKEELEHLFFERTPESYAGICNLLANRIAEGLESAGLNSVSHSLVRSKLIYSCGTNGGLVHDVKLRVERTGNYTFLGGLNLNFNVGESFSMGWGTSWSAGVELADVVGALGSAGGGGFSKASGFMISPFSLKGGISMSDSVGTSVSESTYLVSQIAKFSLDIMAYERCAVVRLSDQGLKHLKDAFDNKVNMPALGLGLADFNRPEVRTILRRGYMVCEGDTRSKNKPRSVEEMYFYFTQHFTEGDMLDQADLYNHPWLLGMRGMRDFVTFVNKIRAQELVGLDGFVSGVSGGTPPRAKAWALDQMSQVYKNTLPSFPGFYSLPDHGEDVSAFLLQQSRGVFSKQDSDPLGEVTRRKLSLNSQAVSGVSH